MNSIQWRWEAATAGFDVLDRRLDPASRAPIAVAFSGGGDSLAALSATKAWGDRCGRRVLALSVDHRLQSQSAAWTLQAAEAAARLGADFHALAWDGPKLDHGLPAAARTARHRLIAGLARGTRSLPAAPAAGHAPRRDPRGAAGGGRGLDRRSGQ